MAIGNYSTAFLIQARTTAKETTYGQDEPTYTDGTRVYWGELLEGGGDRRRQFQQIESRSETVVRLRGEVDISANARLKAKVSGRVYLIDGVHLDGARNETVVECHRLTEA